MNRNPIYSPIAAHVLALALCGCGTSPSPSTLDFPTDPLLSGVPSTQGALRFDVWTAPDQPPTRGTISVKLRATATADGAPVDGLVLDVVPEMPSMGHGTPLVPQVSETGHGTYVATNVNVFMPGRWDLLTTITPASGTADAAAGLADHVTIPLDVR
jgi:hypothetical protein